jgi:hypothetical protein
MKAGLADFVRVRVVRLGTQRPVRVLVGFVDDAFEGREEWVPPARLKVLWEQVGEFREREERWSRLYEAGISGDDGRQDAAERVIELLFDEDEVSIMCKEAGAVRISDAAGLAFRLGLEPGQLTGHPLPWSRRSLTTAFIENDQLVAPWEVTELIVTTAARRNPTPILEYAATEERRAQREAIHGRWSRGGRRSSDYFFEPESCQELDRKHYRPRREQLRAWCGTEAADRFDELTELRKEIRRVGDVAPSAIDALRSAGHASEASGLQRELGTPVAMLQSAEPS